MGAQIGKQSSVENHKRRLIRTYVGACQVPGCRKCGSIVSHHPRQCPVRKFMCEKCSKREHHTSNCKYICECCGGRRSHAMIRQTVLQEIWTASSEFGTYRLCEQRRFWRTCASAQSHQNLRCSLIQAVSQVEPLDRKPDPWPL